MSLGDAMASKIPTGTAATTTSTTAAAPDDEFWDASPATPDTSVDPLPAVGQQTRPNGVVYKPRMIGPHEDLAFLRSAREHSEHVFFYGPPGTGKTAMAEAAFAADANDEHTGIETIVCTADTTEADFMGTFVQDPAKGTFEWLPGPLHRSVMYDVPLLVDEIALCDPRVLSTLYALMDGRGVLRITMNPSLPPLKVGPNWFVIGACNPDVPGAVVSDALRDRFEHHIEVTTDWQLAKELLKAQKVSVKIVDAAKNLDKRRVRGEIGWAPQLRTLLSYARAFKRNGQDYALRNLVSKAPEEDRPVIAETLAQRFGVEDLGPLALGSRSTS